MSQNHHTPITYAAGATTAIVNAPLAQLDAAIDAGAGLVAAEAAARIAADAAIILAGSGVSTTLDGSAASGQKVIPLTATTGITAGESFFIGDATDSETGVVASVSAGVSITAVANLAHSYAAGAIFNLSQAEIALARDDYPTLGQRFGSPPDDANARRFVDMLDRDVEDVTLMVVSDSTGSGSLTWPHKVAVALAARYPAHTVKFSAFDDATKTYPAASTVATGTGANTIWVWNASVAGVQTKYHQRYLSASIASKDPDLVLIAHGHNEVVTDGSTVRSNFLVLTEAILAACPQASIALIAENPRIGDTKQSLSVIPYLQQVAQWRGFGYIDFHRAFEAYGDWAADLMGDAIHPNDAGNEVQAAVVMRALRAVDRARMRAQAPSSLLSAGDNLLRNGDFSDFPAPTLPGWAATGTTLAKDVTYTEMAARGAVRITATGAAASYIAQSVEQSKVPALRGRWVTLLVRGRVAAAGMSAGAGTFLLADDDGNSCSGGLVWQANQCDGFMWAMGQMRVGDAATSLALNLYGDSTANAAADVTWDRAMLCLGVLPRDCPVPDRAAFGLFPHGRKVVGTTIAGNVNDYSPTGSAALDEEALIWELLATGSARNVTGFAAPASGRGLHYVLNGQGQFVVIKQNSGSSSAANRVLCPNNADVTLQNGCGVWIWYSAEDGHWKALGGQA